MIKTVQLFLQPAMGALTEQLDLKEKFAIALFIDR